MAKSQPKRHRGKPTQRFWERFSCSLKKVWKIWLFFLLSLFNSACPLEQQQLYCSDDRLDEDCCSWPTEGGRTDGWKNPAPGYVTEPLIKQPWDFLLYTNCCNKCSLVSRLPWVTAAQDFLIDTPTFLCQSHFLLGWHWYPCQRGGLKQSWSLGWLVTRYFRSL